MNELLIIRHEKGLNKADFANFLDIPKRTYEKWESGERKPPKWVISLIKFKCEETNSKKETISTIETETKETETKDIPSNIKETFKVLHTTYDSGIEFYNIYKTNDVNYEADIHFRESEDKKGYKYNPTWETFEVYRI